MTHQWRDALVTPQTTIVETLKILDKVALRIAMIVDTKMKLLGVVTDGDIRRSLLKNVPLHESISSIMNIRPITITQNEIGEPAQLIMSRHGILSIPVLDNGIVIGLETIQTYKQLETYDNPVFIMAGGFGTRLKPLTDNCPKPMLKIGDKPILETLIMQFKRAGFTNIFISTHYLPETITKYFGDGKNWGVKIRYVHEEHPLGTGGALGLLPEDVQDLPLIMINGDVLTNINLDKLLKFHNNSGGCATMCVREYRHQIPYGVIETENSKVVSMVEKPTQTFFINAGIYVLEPSVFKNVDDGFKIDMPTLLEIKIKAGNAVCTFPIHEYWLDIGRMDDFNKAQIDIWNLGLL